MSFRRNNQFMKSISEQAKARLVTASESVKGQIIELIEEPKSGTHYPGQRVPSSEPGQAPANQSGELVNSLANSPPITTASVIAVHTYSPLVKARFLEAGFAQTAPRPFMRPGLMMSRRAVMQAFSGEGASNVG